MHLSVISILRGLACGLLLPLAVSASAQAQEAKKPNVVLIATGGTIAGVGASSTNIGAYQAAVVAVDKIMAAVPEIQTIANVRGEQIFQVGSHNLTNDRLLQLARRVSELLRSDGVDGIVITHGTDTLEETSYFLNLTVKSNKPVVMLGSMRPGTALSADGPLNLYSAVAVAGSKEAVGKGILVVMNDEIHSARDVTKTNATRVDTFKSPYGPLGLVIEGQARFYRALIRPHTVQSEFDIDKIQTLPQVDIAYGYQNMNRAAYDALVVSGAKGIIHAGVGAGSVPEYMAGPLNEIRGKGVFVVRATRTGSGVVIRNNSVKDDVNDWLVVDDQNPQKARILLALALTKTRDTKELQKIFWRY
ncbi:asparaginase [Polaromonas aquatica]|uniref:asparaginase n=1 Tax=Polaromonas aquatica TaxID=332657 RepID=UPI003D64B4BA